MKLTHAHAVRDCVWRKNCNWHRFCIGLVMKKKKNLLQAYQQAPWRVQLQWIGVFLLILVLIAAVAGVYLNISARSAAAGRRIQVLEIRISELKREINDLSTRLAAISSAGEMYTRIEDEDYVALNPLQVTYLEVPGYQPKTDTRLAPPPNVEAISSPILKPQFTISLWDWLRDNVWSRSETPVIIEEEVIP